MSPDQLNDRFRQAAAHPPEITFAEATERFLNPLPLPPARPWHLNPYLMLTALVAFLAIVSFPYADDSLPLTSFRMDVAASVADPVEPLPVPMYSVPQAMVLPAIGAVVPSPLFNPFPAPAAAAPLSLPNVARSAKVYLPVFTTKEHERKGEDIRTRSSTILLTGMWKFRKKELMLLVADTEGSTVGGYLLTLSTKEYLALKNKDNRPASIVRAAGTVVLLEGRRNGEFEFLPNAAFREKLNYKGWGDAAFNAETPRQNAYLINLADQELYVASNPFELIWFKYFLAGIDEEYIEMLRDFGYTDAELNDLWALADARTNKSLLADVLETAGKMFSDRPALKDFYELQYYPRFGLSKAWDGQPKMTYAEFLALNPFSWDSQPDDMLLRPMDIDSLIITTSPVIGKAELPTNWGLATPGRTADTLSLGNQRLFKVKGRIRVLLDDKLPTNIILIYKKPAADLSFKLGNRTLKISNDCGDEVVDIAVNKAAFRGITTARCAEFLMEIKQKRKGIK